MTEAKPNLPAGIALITSAFFCAAVMSALSKAAAGVPALLLLFLQYVAPLADPACASSASRPHANGSRRRRSQSSRWLEAFFAALPVAAESQSPFLPHDSVTSPQLTTRQQNDTPNHYETRRKITSTCEERFSLRRIL